jgi:hypothetical protein
VGDHQDKTWVRGRSTWPLAALVLGMIVVVLAPASAMAADHVVFLDDDADAASIAASVGTSTELEFSNVANGFVADLTETQVDQLEADPSVVDVQLDSVFALMPFKRAPFKRAPFKRAPFKRADHRSPWHRQVTPTAIDRISSSWVYGSRRNVDADIAILDGGVDASHPDLNVAGAISCVTGAGPEDLDGHGTMVAGLAAAYNNRFGIVGAAPGARIWSVKVADSEGVIMESSAICAMEWVLAHADTIDVANMSWSGEAAPSESSCASVNPRSGNRAAWWRDARRNHRSSVPWRRWNLDPFKRADIPDSGQDAPDPADEDATSLDALQALTCEVYESGVTLVAAAGNDHADAGGYLPAAWPQVMAVSAMSDTDGRRGGRGRAGCLTGDADDTMASYSNFGSVIAIAAPGECLLSTDIDDGYAVGSGTSFAAPLVSGAVARVADRHPRARPDQIRAYLLANAERGPITGDPDQYKEGLLRVRR